MLVHATACGIRDSFAPTAVGFDDINLLVVGLHGEPLTIARPILDDVARCKRQLRSFRTVRSHKPVFDASASLVRFNGDYEFLTVRGPRLRQPLFDKLPWFFATARGIPPYFIPHHEQYHAPVR